MAYTQRVYYGQSFNGRSPRAWQMPGHVNSNSVVVITAAEYDPGAVPPNRPNERVRFVGAANVWVSNISPHEDGSVEFAINVDVPYPLFVVVDITVLDPPQNVVHS